MRSGIFTEEERATLLDPATDDITRRRLLNKIRDFPKEKIADLLVQRAEEAGMSLADYFSQELKELRTGAEGE